MGKSVVHGADCGWLSQLEANGVIWVNENGEQSDPLELLKNSGMEAVRLRVFVDPAKNSHWTKKNGMNCMLGFSDTQGVLEMARRVQGKGLRLMIDFHYSDHFADPEYQDIPKAWEGMDYDGLRECVYGHTREVLEVLVQNEIYPEWVQVGNEINPGMLLPCGDAVCNPEQLAGLLTRGYEAVKEICPRAKVITHLADGFDREQFRRFFDNFLIKYQGKTDVIGFSYYPFWIREAENREFSLLIDNLRDMAERYQKEVMICEVGEDENRESDSKKLFEDVIKAIEEVPNGAGIGVFCWEPEANAAVLTDGYPLGMTRVIRKNTLQFTEAIQAFQKK